jgi:hypothetical protein
MPRLDKSRVQDQDLFSVRDAKSSNVQRVYIPHDTIIGVDGFQASDLTVLGDLIVCGSINGITQTPTSSYVLTASYFLVSASLTASEEFPNYRMLVPMNNVSSSESFYNEAERLTINVVPTSASNDDKNGYIQFYENSSPFPVFAASKSIRYDDRVRSTSGGNLLEALHVEGQIKARNVPYIVKTGAGTYEWKRIINFFPYNGSMTATVAGLESTSNQFFSRNVDAQFQNGTFGMYMMFLGQFATVNNEGGIRSLERFNNHPDYFGNSNPFTLPIQNPVMKGWIRTHSGTLDNINVVIGYNSRNMPDPLDTDRPQRPAGNEGYAFLRFFTGSAGSLTDSYTSRDGANGLRPYAADTRWMLVASGSGTTTQVVQSTGLAVNPGTDYYFELTMNSAGSFSAYIMDESGATGSATINTGITSGTNLGFLANVRAVSGSASARIQRGLGIYFIQFEL